MAYFSASPTEGNEPLTVQFTDKSSGNIINWYWDFGDGHTSSSSNPSHTYNSPGSYTVTLAVSGPGGTSTKTRSNFITVRTEVPNAEFTASPTSGIAPLTVQFTDLSTGYNIVEWSWVLDPGPPAIATHTRHPSYTYWHPSIYDITLIVENIDKIKDTETKVGYITVSHEPPVADFSVSPTSGNSPLTVGVGLSIDWDKWASGIITSWSCDFGDGTTSSPQDRHVEHTYTSAGTYTVTVTVTGPGGSDTVTKVNCITVTEPD